MSYYVKSFVGRWNTLITSLSSSMSADLQRLSYVGPTMILIIVHSAIAVGQGLLIFYFLAPVRHTMHHVMCKPTKPPGGIVKPSKFPSKNDSRPSCRNGDSTRMDRQSANVGMNRQ